MELEDNNIDVIIGPIENYEDALFTQKAAFESKILVTDPEGSKELQMYKDNIENIQKRLP
jgi:hypothetical protein